MLDLETDEKAPPARDVPWLLKIVVPYGGMLLGLGGLLVLGLVACGVRDYSDAHTAISGLDNARRHALIVAIGAILALVTAVAVLKEARWSRHLIALYAFASAALMFGLKSFEPVTFSLAIVTLRVDVPAEIVLALFAVWYLYFKPNVVAYYRTLGQSADRPSALAPPE
jgi:hypothetical protein